MKGHIFSDATLFLFHVFFPQKTGISQERKCRFISELTVLTTTACSQDDIASQIYKHY